MKTGNPHQTLFRPVIVVTALCALSLWPVSAQNVVQPPTKQVRAPLVIVNPIIIQDPGLVAVAPVHQAFAQVFQTADPCLNDTEPPTVSDSVDKDLLWPPNHDLIDVGLRFKASDHCEVRSVSVKVYSDEDDEESTGDGHHSPDAKYENAVLRLRAERKGDSDGRVYLIVVTAIDASGNIGEDCRTVVVPKSQSPQDLKAVQQQAASAEVWCLAFGGPPPGYFLVGDGPVLGPKQ